MMRILYHCVTWVNVSSWRLPHERATFGVHPPGRSSSQGRFVDQPGRSAPRRSWPSGPERCSRHKVAPWTSPHPLLLPGSVLGSGRCAHQVDHPQVHISGSAACGGGALKSVCLRFSSPLNPHFSLAHTSRCAALLLIANTQKQPKCPSADEGTRNTWSIHTVDYYLAMIKDEIMQLEMIILSAGSQKNKFHMTDLRVESTIRPK